MKKITYIFVISLCCVLFSCDKSSMEIKPESNDSRVLGFTSIGSKAIITTADSIASFCVLAYNTGAQNFGDVAIGTVTFMRNQRVFRDSSEESWKYSPVSYWPDNSHKISFFAYSPYDTNRIISVSNKPQIAFTVARNIDEQVDLMYANAIDKTQSSYAGTVPMVFKHALTSVFFSFKGHNKRSSALERAMDVVDSIEVLGHKIIELNWKELLDKDKNLLRDELEELAVELETHLQGIPDLIAICAEFDSALGTYGRSLSGLENMIEEQKIEKGHLYIVKNDLEEELGRIDKNWLKNTTVTKIEIRRVKSKGDLLLGSLSLEDKRWVNLLSDKIFICNLEEKLTSEFVKNKKCFMLIPQTTENSPSARIILTVSKITPAGAVTTMREYKLSNFSWNPGGVVHYRFDIDVSEIKFQE